MKRVLTFLAIMLLPLSVMAMTPVSDSTLSDVTGQAGVNINADLTMNIGIGTIAWGDRTGLDQWDYTGGGSAWTDSDGATAHGYVGVENFNITNLWIRARTDGGIYGTGYPGTNGTYNLTFMKPITIDVATNSTYGSYAAGQGNITFVRFGLGSLAITLDRLNFTVGLGPDTGLAQTLGEVTVGALGIYINPKSYVDIYADETCGVNLAMNVVVDQFNLSYVSWGDTDGVDNYTTTGAPTSWTNSSLAGYVGVSNLTIGGPIIVSGTVSINVVSLNAGSLANGLYAGHGATTIVHIAFGGIPNGYGETALVPANNFIINVGAIAGIVRLSNNRSFGVIPGDYTVDNTFELGDFYVGGLDVTIGGGSWVDIWAH